MKDVSIKVELVTPEIAATLLGTMDGNRPLRTRAVQRYAREMLAGRWLLNGEAIKVDRRGKLIDGQHRLNAVLMTKKSVQMLVVRGVDESAKITLDTGIGRSFHDAGVIAGRHYARAVGPICRWWFRYDAATIMTSITPTHQELEAIRIGHPAIETSAGFLSKLKTVMQRCTPSVQGFVHSYASEKYDREMADSFMSDLNDGAELHKTSPIFLLRRRLIDDPSSGHLEAHHVLALTIKAWNAWLDGAAITYLRWATGGEAPEAFPRFGQTTAGTRWSRKQREAARQEASAGATTNGARAINSRLAR